MSETINNYGMIYWKYFSKQNYFDKHGVFIGILFSAPLLIIGFIQLVSYHILLILFYFIFTYFI